MYSYTVAHLCGAIVPLSSFHQMATFLSRFATSYSTNFDFTFPLASPERGLRISEERATQSFHDSSHVSETKIVLDSGFWALDSILFISGTWILVSAANICQIPDSKLSRIPDRDSGFPYKGRQVKKAEKKCGNASSFLMFILQHWIVFYRPVRDRVW